MNDVLEKNILSINDGIILLLSKGLSRYDNIILLDEKNKGSQVKIISEHLEMIIKKGQENIPGTGWRRRTYSTYQLRHSKRNKG